MKKYIIIAAIFAALVAVVSWQFDRIKKIQADRDAYQTNTDVLMADVKKYKANDSLNAITVGGLELKLAEFQKYRADDAKLIKALETRNRNLERVTTTQTQTISQLRGTVRDSIIYRDNYIVDTLRCIDIVEPWFELHGCANENREFTGTHTNRDSLLIAETVEYKRFLGFLWKTSKIKNRKVDVVSKNPGTEIMGVEFVTIRK